MAREPYYKEFIPKSSMLPKTVLEYRTPETLQLPPKQLGELCQVFQLEELIMSQGPGCREGNSKSECKQDLV